jgi:hypothetical protein
MDKTAFIKALTKLARPIIFLGEKKSRIILK